ncbi:hypothetical protein AB0I38_23935 [Nonomuraea cavernae]
MAATDILPAEGEWFDETLAQTSPDMLREMVMRMAQMMMDAEVEQRCGAGYGEVSRNAFILIHHDLGRGPTGPTSPANTACTA